MSVIIRQLTCNVLSGYDRFIAKSAFTFMVLCWLSIVLAPQELVYAKPENASKEDPTHKVRERSAEQAFLVMQEQLRGYREKLQESERALEEFQQKHGIIALETQIDHLLQQRKALDDSLNEAENQAMGFKEKLAWVEKQISQVPKEVPLSSTVSEQGIIGSAKNKLLALQLEEQELLSKYTKTSPHLRAVHQEMELIERFIKEQEETAAGSVTRGKNPLYREMEMQLFQTRASLVSSNAQRAVIIQQIAKVDKELARLRSLKPGVDALRRQVKADEVNYLNYLTQVGTTPPQDYQVQVGDLLDIKFFFNPELNESIPVRPDGRIALQLVGEISVVGYTVEEIREILTQSYSGQLKNPEIAVLLRTSHVRAATMGSQGGTINAGAGNAAGAGNGN